MTHISRILIYKDTHRFGFWICDGDVKVILEPPSGSLVCINRQTLVIFLAVAELLHSRIRTPLSYIQFNNNNMLYYHVGGLIYLYYERMFNVRIDKAVQLTRNPR